MNRALGKYVRIADVRWLAMLDSIESFFLARSHDLALDNQCSGRLVEHRVDSENVYPALWHSVTR